MVFHDNSVGNLGLFLDKLRLWAMDAKSVTWILSMHSNRTD